MIGETKLAPEEERLLAPLARGGDGAARGRLIDSVMNLIRWFAPQFERANIGRDDLAQEGVIGALEAIPTFDPAKGRWHSWAAISIQAAMRRARTKAALVAIPQSKRRQAREYVEARGVLIAEDGFEPTDDEVAERMGVSTGGLDSIRAAAHGPATKPLGGIDAVFLAPASEMLTEEALNAEEAERRDQAMRRWIRDAIISAGGSDLEAILTTGSVLDGWSTTQMCMRSRSYRMNHRNVKELVERGKARLRDAWRARPGGFTGSKAAA